jgi:uncharacterized membrane protein
MKSSNVLQVLQAIHLARVLLVIVAQLSHCDRVAYVRVGTRLSWSKYAFSYICQESAPSTTAILAEELAEEPSQTYQAAGRRYSGVA